MADYLLDTNHISPLVTPGHRLRPILTMRRRQGDSFHIAVPALTEMLFGIKMLPRAQRNIEEWRKFAGFFTYHQIEKDDAEDAADLQVSLRQQGWQLGTVDALIASISLRNDLILLSTDKDYTAVPNLALVNWLAIEAESE